MSDDYSSKGETNLDTESQLEPAKLENDLGLQKRKTLDMTSQSEGITVEVCNPITREEKLIKHTVYTIRGVDKDGNFETIRRYSDFDKIRALLVIRWPAVAIPPLPPKKSVSNMDPKFIEERKRALDQFCKCIALIPFLHYCEEFQLFLRSSTPDLEKSLQVFQKTSYEDMITKYTSTFHHLGGKDLTNETVLKISGFKLFLTKTKGQFEKFRTISRTVAQAKRSYYDQLSLFHNMTMVPYEKNVFSEYHGNKEGRNVFYDTTDQRIAESGDRLKAINRESFEYINEFIEQEAREIDAFLEALNQREKYENLKLKTLEKQKSETDDLHKLVSGKKTLKSMFTKKTKEEEIAELEKIIATYGTTHDQLSSLHDMMTLIVAYEEIEKFRKTRVEGYFKVLGISGANELKNLDDLQEFWSTVMANQNIKDLDGDVPRY